MRIFWIDISKVKPENDINVLVYSPEEESVTIAKYYDDIEAFMDETDAEFQGSHWMPLPQPPNVKEGKQ